MKKICLPACALGVLVSMAGGTAWAQIPNYQLPSSRPAVSPWLNLLRPGSNPANNYYNLVQPQFEFGAGINNLQQQTLANRGAISSLEGGLAAQYTTGHRTGFMTQNRYFLNNNSGAAGTSRGPAGGNRALAGPTSSSSGLGQGFGQGSGGIGQGYGGGSGQSYLPR
jgi:hypothetical protein